jgi:16S rRNA (cytosine967-C5)-methyltransferase
MIGALRAAGTDPAEIFTGTAYAPSALTESDITDAQLQNAPRPVQLDMPDWLFPQMDQSLGADCDAVLQALRQRAPVFLRVNLAKTTLAKAQAALAGEDISTAPHPLSATALEVTGNPRRVANSQAYQDGLIELQDAASQAVVDRLPRAARILDYCAGGGGKSLALAARPGAQVFAHDVDPMRMQDIPNRANRAGVEITQVTAQELTPHGYDLVFCDAPCSGSGSWRRSPDAKWRLSADRLAELCALQADILETAKTCVAPGGTLAYATCSLLNCENSDQIQSFLSKNPNWVVKTNHRFTPLDGGDGFYVAVLTRT